ncbi:MAG: chemotaxis protein CheA [Roseovarius sp.]|uniref:chemotaxis protein CheA n=1 Tax=Roseovarius sp. TaxID=1486281 RepID=UPI0032EE2BBA
MSSGGTEDFRSSFFEECEELLESMHDGFDLLADGAQDSETMNAIFRAVHSIKGGAGAFGFTDLVTFAHQFETALDHVRSGKCDADEELLDLFRHCGDHLSDLVAAARSDGEVPPRGEELLERLGEATGTGGASAEEEPPDFEPVTLNIGLGASEERVYTIRFAAEPGLFACGNEPLVLFRALAGLGMLEVGADLSAVPPLDGLDPMDCRLDWTATLATSAQESEIMEVFEFVDGLCRLDIEAPGVPDLPEVPPAGGLPSLSELIGTDGGSDTAATGAEAPGPEQAAVRPDANAPRPGGTIRVDLDKIDKLINLVGELVIKEAMLSQSIADLPGHTESDLSAALESLKQLAGEIQEGVMAVRAQPVKPMFQRMARIVREAGTATGKRVKLVTNGEFTEVDKTVIERLVDPLTHMIRNAIDHGLEPGDRREAAGKPREGTVTISAAHRSGRVMIDVADDGGGINREKVRSLAIERGLISAADTLSASEIDNLLFLPGFSSKDEVSELSGRGVGLDVVRSEIQTLGGRVAIHSEPGEGTVFSISLPLTLAVLEGMVIRVANQTMVVPISAIHETLQPRSAAIHAIGAGGWVLKNRSGLVPVIDLGHFFGFRSPVTDIDSHVLLLIESDASQYFALIVDDIQEQRQVVIKSLETNYQQVQGVAAATILGDGRIALIIDPDNITRGSVGLGGAHSSIQMAV